MKPELIVALDVPSAAAIPDIVNRLPEAVRFYKVGLELFVASGPDALTFLQQRGKRIFLDLKLHDIPRTVARAVGSASGYGVALLTVHAGGGRAMLTAAAEACPAGLDIVAVTTLTSLDQGDLTELGVSRDLRTHTTELGALAIDCGISGLVCSPLEISAFRQRIGADPLIVTPGIRPADGELGDQKRVATPTMAVADGASYLVVGRPILEAADPGLAAERILQEIETAARGHKGA
ncbi:MAG TPA: orotidine-5'-phosphate decarboxylase [Verrucomicrobia bacterium]|nr:orotidine-5'-phosphate decarboxylase [Verrucomicrobiota bacterium]